MEPLSALYGWLTSLALKAVEKRVSTDGEKFVTRAMIKGRVESCIGRVVDSLEPFFRDEGMAPEKRMILVDECRFELEQLSNAPDKLLSGSLDGEKVYEQVYEHRQLPETIRRQGLEYNYSLLFPRVAHILCRVPGIVEQWKSEARAENFRRLDDLGDAMGDLTRKVDELTTVSKKRADELFSKIRRAVLQRVSFKIDLTGLRGDKPEQAFMEQMFVLPELLFEQEKIRDIIVSVEDNLRAFTTLGARTVIQAGGGAGKSTWAMWLQRCGLTSDSKLAISLRLRDWVVNDLPSKESMIRMAAGQHLAEEISPEWISDWFSMGVIAIIMDGFDEVKPSARDGVLQWIESLGDAAANCPVVVTSRPLTTGHLNQLPAQWRRYTMQPFDKARIEEYISKWYKHYPGLREEQRAVDVARLANVWHNDAALDHLVGNPLMLATLLMVHHLDGALPNGRASLYKRYIDGMLGLWDDRRQLQVLAVQLKREHKRCLLTRIALELHLSEQDQIGEDALLELLADELTRRHLSHSARSVLDLLQERTGLLVGPGTFSFVHKSVAEFLLAETLEDGLSYDSDGESFDRARLFAERNNDRWNNILFFWAGLTRRADLEGFLDLVANCDNLSDWKLTIGLLYDASERLPIENFRRRFSEALSRVPELDEDDAGGWTVLAPPLDEWEAVPVHDLDIRGVQDASFWSRLEELVREKKVNWAVCEGAADVIKVGIWIQFVSSTLDVAEFEKVLSSGDPNASTGYIPCPAFALDWHDRLWDATGIDREWMLLRIRTVSRFFPEIAGYAPIALLTSILTGVHWGNIHERMLSRKITVILDLLDGADGIEWEDRWLSVTNKLDMTVVSAESSDLLSLIVESFSSQSTDAQSVDPELRERIAKYAVRLMIRRDGAGSD